MVEYVEKKLINWKLISNLLNISQSKNHFSNFGPLSIILENKIHSYISLSSNKSVVVCSSGTSALHALVEMHNYLNGKSLKWVTSNFTFPCAVQGPLKNAIVVDCNTKGNLSLEVIKHIDFDGIIVTDLFGMTNRQPYRDYCASNNKILIVDSAMGFDKPRQKDDEIISFHHTKPWGFGEGGCVIIDKKNETLLRSLINFGLMKDKDNTQAYSTNAKISEVASAFILQRLEKMPKVKKTMQVEYKRISNIAQTLGIEIYADCPEWTPPCVPLFNKTPVSIDLKNPFITMKKYYKPLRHGPIAQDLYERVIVMPCHPDVKKCTDKEIKEALSIVTSKYPC